MIEEKEKEKKAKLQKQIGGVPWGVLREKLRNPNLADLKSFIETLSQEEKLLLLKYIESDFAKQHFYLSKFVPETYKKAGKANIV